MKKLIILLMLCPLFTLGQIKKATVLQNDIYSEFPVNGIPFMNGKTSGVRMYCGNSPEAQPIERFQISMNCRGSKPVENQPLYIINDFIVEDIKITSLNPNDIETINVLKDASAIKKYGSKAKNGVIEITLKNNITNTITKAENSKPVPKL